MTDKYYFMATSLSTGSRYVCESDRPANGYREADSGGYATACSYGVCIYFKHDGEWIEEDDPRPPMFFSNSRWEVFPLVPAKSDNTIPDGFEFL